MKVGEAVRKLLVFMGDGRSDLEIGIQDGEFSCFNAVSDIILHTAERPGGVSDDDESLGDRFVGIEYECLVHSKYSK